MAESQGPSATRVATPILEPSLSFEPNVGQVGSQVHYLSRGVGYGLFLTHTEAVLVLQRPISLPQQNLVGTSSATPPAPINQATLRLRFVGKGVRTPHPKGLHKLSGKSHYFLGNDPSNWHTNVPHYARVVYEGLYPGIDLIYYGREGQLEYDLVLAPGANPNDILLEIQGVERLTLLPEGDLSIETTVGLVRHHKPVIYQLQDGVKHAIGGAYRLKDGNRVGFEIASYDPTRALYIDPVLGSSSYFESDGVFSLALDENENIYLTGAALPSLPTTVGTLQDSSKGFLDAFVSKFDSTGTNLVYSTFLGGSLDDQGRDIAVDEEGNAYVVGISSSSDFPTVDPIQSENAGSYDVFVAKLTPAGNALLYSTYLGGVGEDGYLGGLAVALDEPRRSGSTDPKVVNVYLSGSTNSPDFLTVNALQPNYNGGVDAFIAKVGGPGPQLLYSTFLGGTNSDFGGDVTVDRAAPNEEGNAYVVGTTSSEDFPIVNPLQPEIGGDSDIFVTKFQPDGQNIIYSTYLGGEDMEEGRGVTVNQLELVYVTGHSDSENYPLRRAAQEELAGGLDVVVSQIVSDGTSLRASTYVGGNGDDLGLGIALDSDNQPWITGSTDSEDFPFTPTAPQRTQGMGDFDAFVLQLSSAGRVLEYATYLGGDGNDEGRAIAANDPDDADALSNIYVGGRTTSSDFPRTAPRQPQPSGGFVAKLTEGNASQADMMITMEDSPEPVEQGALLTYTITVTNQGPISATGVTVTTKSDPRFRRTASGASQGTCEGLPNLVCQVGTVAPNDQVTIRFAGIPLAGQIEMAASASVLSALPDLDLSNNSVQVFTLVNTPSEGPISDLSVIKNDDPDPATIGVPYMYTMTVTNNGPDAATNVILTDTLPPGVTVGSATLTQGTCTGNRELICQLGSLEVEATATVTLSVISTNVGDLMNEAFVTSSSTDPFPDNDFSAEETMVMVPVGTEVADLLIALPVQPSRILNPDISSGRATATWRMQILNDGPDLGIDVQATSRLTVQVLDKIPPTTVDDLDSVPPTPIEVRLEDGIDFKPRKRILDSSDDPSECTPCKCVACMGLNCNENFELMLPDLQGNELVVSCDIGNLFPQEEFTLEFTTELTQGIHSNTATVTTLTFDPDLLTNQITTPLTVAVTPGAAPIGGEGDDDGCFIATAAYGSSLAPEVDVLRQFRDQYLLPSTAGQLLVRAYYFLSPPVAEFISQQPALKAVIRVALWPLVWWTNLTLNSPYLGLTVILGGLLILYSLFYLTIQARNHHNRFSFWKGLR